MSDHPAEPTPESQLPPAATQPAGGEATQESAGAEQKEKWPPGPPVFGKWAFFITVVPYLVYLAGNMGSDFIESSRVHTQVIKQKSYARGALNEFRGRLEKDFGSDPGKLQILENKMNIPAIDSKLEAEEFESEKLAPLIEPLKDTSNVSLNYSEKATAVEQLEVLVKMRELEEKNKTREALAMSHRHFNKIEGQDTDLEDTETDSATSDEWFPEDKTWYPVTYMIVIALTALLMAIAFPGYFRAPFKLSWLAVVVGVVGIFVWVGLSELDRHVLHIGDMLGSILGQSNTEREAFNPLKELKSNPTWMWQWLTVRFIGLVLIVPFVEEFFLRGWFMRYLDHPDWDDIPLGTAGTYALVGIVGYAALSHPAELVAAVAWFSLITWLYLKTKSIWDCVVAHGITNLLLGIYVMWTGSWYLW